MPPRVGSPLSACAPETLSLEHSCWSEVFLYISKWNQVVFIMMETCIAELNGSTSMPHCIALIPSLMSTPPSYPTSSSAFQRVADGASKNHSWTSTRRISLYQTQFAFVVWLFVALFCEAVDQRGAYQITPVVCI